MIDKVPLTQVATYLKQDVYNELRTMAQSKGIPVSHLLREMIQTYLDVQKEEAVYDERKKLT